MAVLRLNRLPNHLPAGRTLRIAGAALALGLAGVALYAQIEGDRGIAPIASTGDFEVSGIDVNATGKNAADARANGWRQAQRLAWQKLWTRNGMGGGMGGGTAPALDDGTINAMVSAVVVEHEEIGPHRYIAKLGVIFDRARTGSYLGMQGQVAHSAPLLVIPLLIQGGANSVFETRTPWQKAWAEFHTGESVIDYVRPSGGGSDSLLLTAGQVSRRSRTWWRLVLDEFGAADVLIPVARLEREWPGGPVKGTFTARFGPDDSYLDSFELTAPDDEHLPAMLTEAVKRIDAIYARALAEGVLRPDPSLNTQPQIDPKLIDAIVARLGPSRPAGPAQEAAAGAPKPAASATPTSVITVQFVTPDAAAVDAGLAAVRGIPGVQGARTTSIAMGGVSVLKVTYAGELEGMATALRAQGWKVTVGSGALIIRR
ncbi:heavy-metal-associated domain-containing protein [Novosphingobium sp.]|uniref:heavy-metal-associated domain-containing protein n=1 Tax=Novosphingobium sp. TaxID=1874826 RepID=UPI0038BB4211